MLKTAFEGRLVPQDPTDEPASVLLDRIPRRASGESTEAPRTAADPRGGSHPLGTFGGMTMAESAIEWTEVT